MIQQCYSYINSKSDRDKIADAVYKQQATESMPGIYEEVVSNQKEQLYFSCIFCKKSSQIQIQTEQSCHIFVILFKRLIFALRYYLCNLFKQEFQNFYITHYSLHCIILLMYISRMPFKVQPMNLVHTSKEGTQLWLGDYYAATNLNLLKQKNIKSVLTSAAMLGVNYPKDAQINHKVINALDLPSFKMTPYFQEAFEFIQEALKKGNILVHCAAGISRSTTFVLVYLMRAEKMTFKQALDYVRAKRTIVCPNDGFQKELKRFETSLKNIILPKIQKQKQENMSKSQNVQGKQPIQPENTLKQSTNKQVKMNSTFSNNLNQLQQKNEQNNKGIERGKSLNFSSKPTQTKYKDVKPKIEQKGSLNAKIEKSTNLIANTFLTYKLQNPKIVTIKK